MSLNEMDRRNALNEVRILASISHPNVIKYKEAFFEENTKDLCTVMELAPNGDLSTRIK
jgi:NIMA (never in mitosis gene a)-related kinase